MISIKSTLQSVLMKRINYSTTNTTSKLKQVLSARFFSEKSDSNVSTKKTNTGESATKNKKKPTKAISKDAEDPDNMVKFFDTIQKIQKYVNEFCYL